MRARIPGRGGPGRGYIESARQNRRNRREKDGINRKKKEEERIVRKPDLEGKEERRRRRTSPSFALAHSVGMLEAVRASELGQPWESGSLSMVRMTDAPRRDYSAS
jgi:hypothetical protein